MTYSHPLTLYPRSERLADAAASEAQASEDMLELRLTSLASDGRGASWTIAVGASLSDGRLRFDLDTLAPLDVAGLAEGGDPVVLHPGQINGLPRCEVDRAALLPLLDKLAEAPAILCVAP